jgi:hypothetical protein
MGVIQIIIISVFLGFTFQSFTKLFRDAYLDRKILDEIENRDDKLYNDAKKILKVIPCTKEEKIKNNIYLIHNYLVVRYGNIILPEFFSERLALWSNMMFASFMSIIFIPIMSFYNVKTKPFSGDILLDILLLLIFANHSYNITKKYLYALFDATIRTFVSVQFLNAKSLKTTLNNP